MLIINADDLGRAQAATDRALACYEHKRLFSTSAMVFMEDSERAARLALSGGIDVGLHINLSERFTAQSVPASLLERHDRICRFLNGSKYAPLLYNPLLREQFLYVFEAQFAEFFRLYGRTPSHLDGHHHMHLACNVLIGRILPARARIRRSFSFRPGEKSLVNRLYRAAVNRYLARRHQLPDYFFALSKLLTPYRFEQIVSLSTQTNVEVMTHPEEEREYAFLMSDRYVQAVSQVRLVGHNEL